MLAVLTNRRDDEARVVELQAGALDDQETAGLCLCSDGVRWHAGQVSRADTTALRPYGVCERHEGCAACRGRCSRCQRMRGVAGGCHGLRNRAAPMVFVRMAQDDRRRRVGAEPQRLQCRV